jgi:uncharacterized protein (DUF58 family)
MQKDSDLVLFSDFLDPIEEITRRLDTIAHRNIRGHLVHIIDPAEEAFPYAGRTQFVDPETGNELIAGRAEQLGEGYRALFQARKKALADHCQKIGWNHIVHHTDQPASAALVALHMRLGETPLTAGGTW